MATDEQGRRKHRRKKGWPQRVPVEPAVVRAILATKRLTPSEAARVLECDQRTLDAVLNPRQRVRSGPRRCGLPLATAIAGLVGLPPEILEPDRFVMPPSEFLVTISGPREHGLPTAGEAAYYVFQQRFMAAAARDWSVVPPPCPYPLRWSELAKQQELPSAWDAFVLHITEFVLPKLFSLRNFRWWATGVAAHRVEREEADRFMIGTAQMVEAGLEPWLSGGAFLNWEAIYELAKAVTVPLSTLYPDLAAGRTSGSTRQE